MIHLFLHSLNNSLRTYYVPGLGKSGLLTPWSSQSSKKERQGKSNSSVMSVMKKKKVLRRGMVFSFWFSGFAAEMMFELASTG